MSTFLEKIEQDYLSLKTKLAGASARLNGYVSTGIKLGTELENFTNSGVGRLVIPEVLDKIGVHDSAMREDIINAIPKALSYATQAQNVLTAPTPEDQLNLFLADIANDAPGTKVAKIDLVVEKVIANLDNNSLIGSLYKWLLSHAKTANPDPVVVNGPVQEVTVESANA